VFYDSSVCFFCAGDVGYRWAMKVTALIARNAVPWAVDALFFPEILDGFFHTREPLQGEVVYGSFRRLAHGPVSVTVEDFDQAALLHERHPGLSPRVALRAAVARRHGSTRMCATFAAGFESVEGIDRVNLMEEVTR
jgi:hypothetical protein